MWYVKFRIKKLFQTLKLCYRIFKIRTFGEYIVSGWDSYLKFSYAEYKYKDETWIIPIEAVDHD